jgi:hypothetical protein
MGFTMDRKKCRVCGVEKDLTNLNFLYRKDSNKYRNECKKCKKKMDLEYKRKNSKILNKNKRIKRQRKMIIKEIKESFISEKSCIKCGVAFERSEKYFRSYEKSGNLSSICNMCRKKIRLEYKKTESYKKSKKKSDKKYRRINIKKIKEKDRLYRIKNKEKESERYKNDLNFRIAKLARNRINMAIRSKEKYKNTFYLLGCDINYLKEWLASQFSAKMNWDNYGSMWHIDHILPCSEFDLKNSEEQDVCFHYTNLRPLWASENLSKGNRVI